LWPANKGRWSIVMAVEFVNVFVRGQSV